jgi:hypothetical protein
MSDARREAQLESAHYRDMLLFAIKRDGPERLAHLAELSLLATHVITEEFKRRYPAEYAAWNEFGDEHGTADSQV